MEQQFFLEIHEGLSQQAAYKVKMLIKNSLCRNTDIFTDHRSVEVILKDHQKSLAEGQILIN